jgi:O-acetyl-ADP-ribose deacetylase (regulator of RNase III)
VFGDLLDQPVDAIVNAWNRNVIPWWLLLPQGVSGAIKRRGGSAPFRELGQLGAIPLGGAVLTGAGRLQFRGIIHVAGINLLWRASEQSIRLCVRNACALAARERFATLALPAIGAGSGGFDETRSVALIVDELETLSHDLDVVVVRFRDERAEKLRARETDAARCTKAPSTTRP